MSAYNEVITCLKSARFFFVDNRLAQKWDGGRYRQFIDALKELTRAIDLLAELGIDMNALSDNWRALFDAGDYICVHDSNDVARIDKNIVSLSWAIEKDCYAAVKLVCARLAMALCALPLDSEAEFKQSLGVKLESVTRSKVASMAAVIRKERKEEEKARKAAEKAAKKASAPKKPRKSAAQKELDAVMAAIQAQFGDVMKKNPKTGQYEFVKVTA